MRIAIAAKVRQHGQQLLVVVGQRCAVVAIGGQQHGRRLVADEHGLRDDVMAVEATRRGERADRRRLAAVDVDRDAGEQDRSGEGVVKRRRRGVERLGVGSLGHLVADDPGELVRHGHRDQAHAQAAARPRAPRAGAPRARPAR